MSDKPLAIEGLAATWRDAAVWEWEENSNSERASALDQCAHDLDAALPEVRQRIAALEQEKAVILDAERDKYERLQLAQAEVVRLIERIAALEADLESSKRLSKVRHERVEALVAERDDLLERARPLNPDMPKTGPNAVLDQQDADLCYLSTENRDLKATLAAREQEVRKLRTQAIAIGLAFVGWRRDLDGVPLLDAIRMIRAEAEAREQEIAALKAEVQARSAEVENWVTHYNELEKWRISTAQLKANAEARVQQLIPFVQHKDRCVKSPNVLGTSQVRVCTCGLDAALRDEVKP